MKERSKMLLAVIVGGFAVHGAIVACGTVSGSPDALPSDAFAADAPLDVLPNVMTIDATVRGVAGGTVTAACPQGFTLTSVSLVNVNVTQGGSNGWPMGTYGCGRNDGQLVASLSNYATGSDQSTITCEGLCVK